MTQPRTDPAIVATFRCGLDIDGERFTAYRQVDRMILADHPEVRDRVEYDLRSEVARKIVEELSPEVEEADLPSTAGQVSRDEALRLAKQQAKALARLADRLEEAGENYALPDAWQARDAAHALVARLESDDGRLPTDPRFWSGRRH